MRNELLLSLIDDQREALESALRLAQGNVRRELERAISLNQDLEAAVRRG